MSPPAETSAPDTPAADPFVHPVALPHTPVTRALDAFVKGVGDVVSWLWVVLVLVIVVNVTSRYAFSQGFIVFEEIQWHLYAVAWLVGLSYAVQNDGHIRIDIFHERFKPRTKAWIDFLGVLFFLIPYTFVVLRYSPEWIGYSFQPDENSDAPGGLPYRWIIKSTLFLAYLLLLIAAISRLLRAARLLFGGRDFSING